MQKILFFLLLQMIFQKGHALQIHQIRISEISPALINVSLDTEAEELYYFHSWRSKVSGSNITIEAFYIEGFGSTIAYLNNNFKIPINPRNAIVYRLNVRIYYTNLRVLQNSNGLQDQWQGSFSTPLSTPIFLSSSTENNPLNFKFQNPNPGFINIGSQKISISIFDNRGNIVENKQAQESINFTHLPDGLYYFRLMYENTVRTIPVILRK